MKVYCPKHYKYGTLKFKLIDEAELERYLAEGWDVLPSGRILIRKVG